MPDAAAAPARPTRSRSRQHLARAVAPTVAAATALVLAATLGASAATSSTVPAPDGTAWTDVDGNPIKAHGGSVVTVHEAEVGLDITGDGDTDDDVWLWYGEDKTHATRPVDGVRGYWSTDLTTWHDMGRVLPSHQHFTLRVNGAGNAVEVDPAKLDALQDVANKTAPDAQSTQEDIDAAKAFVAPYVETWADEAAGVAATYDEAALANASYRLNGNINIMERPKMLWNARTKKFVIIYHADGPLADNADLVRWVRDGGDPADQNVGSRYSRAEIGFATSDTPWGPFKLVNTTKMNWAPGVPNAGREGDSRDMTIFQDAGEHTVDAVADDAYAVYSSEMNTWMYVSRLNAEYTGPLETGSDATLGEDFSNRVLPDYSREASSVFKHDGWYYMLTSGTDGWASTPVVAYRSRSMITPTEAVVGDNNRHPANGQWERLGNPCVGDPARTGVGTADPVECFDSQPTFVIALDQEAGRFAYMGDRWITESNGSAGERSRYVWAPIQVRDGRVTVENVGAWDPENTSLFHPLEPVTPLDFTAHVDDRDEFAPTFDVTVDGQRYDDLTADWSTASLDAAFATRGTHTLVGHVAGDGPLAGRYVTATVEVDGPVDVCREPGTTVSASFHQTEYGTMPAAWACDGNTSTAWSTWAGGTGKKDRVTFTVQSAEAWSVDAVRLTNTEGTISGITVEHRDAEGTWWPTTASAVAPAPNGSMTTVPFDAVTTDAVRVTFDTPGSYLKISELSVAGSVPGEEPADPELAVASEAQVRCLAGRAYVAVRATNEDDVPVAVTLSTPFGSRSVAQLAPGASAYQSFATRAAAADEVAVTVTASADVDGVTVTDLHDLVAPAASCG
ncbi:glycoside hydrolase family 43 protein [Cellulosimicrobium marinum]|uniref:glycoside hydrolase family 43 protein n=1 Tax=Cellulosimicrobium marinum TaxID=1638992 RepID=UPI001E3EEB32|nr:glycoside hydrolase family 43 protein [Cellulosimicrobium marinum]MCB7137437.1 glycoside hydrolase family 43 protein [Cellulosimicrobium marinum]